MAVTAKIICSSVTTYMGGQAGLKFQPDYQDGRNKEWAQSTPTLDYSMTVKAEVATLFKPGKSYTVTFEENQI